jgi:hypothetical protein
VLDREVFVLEAFRLLLSSNHYSTETGRDKDLPSFNAGSRYPGTLLELLIKRCREGLNAEAELREYPREDTPLLMNKGVQQVLAIDLLMPEFHRNRLSSSERFL